jgi:peroxin-3
LTILYSTSLLSLLTMVQLTVLARYKYVRSIQKMEYDQRSREAFESKLSLSSLLFSGGLDIESLISKEMSGYLDPDEPEDLTFEIPEEESSKYLTLSWWMLHVGWKDVAERVRRAVEETLDG